MEREYRVCKPHSFVETLLVDFAKEKRIQPFPVVLS
ncbi:MAG: hypothetical protein JWO58_1940 [Chitinophagaceae bacterium]|nr:hypothetical protein [Chitinophagaceae bacterium]